MDFGSWKKLCYVLFAYSHLSNSQGGWNKRGGGAKVAKSLNMKVGINVEGGMYESMKIFF